MSLRVLIEIRFYSYEYDIGIEILKEYIFIYFIVDNIATF